ncbi:hypothetical protein [Pseudomonas aeruginosa]|uniref:hypothetical protein n=1 Tax=Pseudomonas aeruginosa TaxID=287 RepID=UPI003D9C4788
MKPWALSANAAAARGDLGLGNAATRAVQTSPTDTTAGALMAVGAFGLGTNSAQTATGDVNELRLGGIFAPVSQANTPTAECVIWSGGRANGARAAQFAIDHGLMPKAFVRGYNGGRTAGTEWGSWYELYHRGNIVGTVSQTSNIPTGAVIERGRNANGEYVRFADGTQICWLLSFRITQSGSSSTILERPWSFPASFSNTDVVTLVSHSNNGSRRNELNIANFKRAFSDTNTGLGNVNIGMEFTSGVIAASWFDIPVYAIGRWY